MSIDPSRTYLAIQQGVSAVCALCEHFHNAQDNNLSDCGQNCGGPMSGGAFDKYQGPIVDFSKFCFICSAPSTHAVRAEGNVRVLGCCAAHVDTVKQWKPQDRPSVNIIIKSPDHVKSTDDCAIPTTKIKLKF